MKIEETLSSTWDQHLASEFAAKSPEQALATMTAEPYVNVVPLMTGGRGRDEVRDFYENHFLSQLPPDTEIVPVSRTIGQGRVVDELIIRFTHSIRMDLILPGIAPTGKRVEVPMVAIAQFEGDRVAHEHIYWDQASVLVQAGLLNRTLPVRGGEIAAQVLNPTQPMNELIRRAITDPKTGDNMEARPTPLQATIIKPEQALSIKPFGLDVKVLLSTEATGGAISVLMGRNKPGEGPGDHVHFNQEEIFFIVEGTFELTVGGQTTTAGPGTIVFIPRNVVHRFKNVGDTTGCMLDWSLPGGQDHYFKAISELAASGGFTGEKVTEINKKFDTKFLAAH